MALVHLPPVLILHLKRFLFNSTGSQKINKHVGYDMNLEISKGELKRYTVLLNLLKCSSVVLKLYSVALYCCSL